MQRGEVWWVEFDERRVALCPHVRPRQLFELYALVGLESLIRDPLNDPTDRRLGDVPVLLSKATGGTNNSAYQSGSNGLLETGGGQNYSLGGSGLKQFDPTGMTTG